MEEGCGAREGGGKRLPFERTPVPGRPARALRQGWGSLFVVVVDVVRACGLWVGVYICAPRFFHVSGWGSSGGCGCSFSWVAFCRRAAGTGTFLALRRCVCCCVLSCAAAVPRGRDPGPRWAWCGVADGGGGGDLLLLHGWVWRVMRGGGALD